MKQSPLSRASEREILQGSILASRIGMPLERSLALARSSQSNSLRPAISPAPNPAPSSCVCCEGFRYTAAGLLFCCQAVTTGECDDRAREAKRLVAEAAAASAGQQLETSKRRLALVEGVHFEGRLLASRTGRLAQLATAPML